MDSNIFLSHGMCDGLLIDTKKGVEISKMMTLKMWQKQIDSWDGQSKKKFVTFKL